MRAKCALRYLKNSVEKALLLSTVKILIDLIPTMTVWGCGVGLPEEIVIMVIPIVACSYYKIDPDTGDAVRVDRCCKLIEGAELFEPCTSLAVLTYYWKGEPEYFEVGPQRRVRIADAAERSRLEMQYPSQSNHNQPCFTDRTRAPSPPAKRPRVRADEEESGSGIHSVLYRTEYELQERQASLLDRFEAFMDRLERISMCLPQLQEPVQQVWVGGASHDDDTIAHEEEIIIEDGNFNEDYSNIS
ncbi:hypothetical protein TELCIR_10638 [Teladorsagia circumcincta]|uniref:Uncharacterized protein n=1 Tax=Teladorsagia circumcincta TaxID=45464 RepID=A0A2G9UBK9_TELCI|nr:hypothetical protein TELCIR_10638 [Teladorsagia circumcincta]